MNDCGTIDEVERRLNEAWRRLTKSGLQVDVGLSQQAIVRKLSSTNCADPELMWIERPAAEPRRRMTEPGRLPYYHQASISAAPPVMRLYFDDRTNECCFEVHEQLMTLTRRPDVNSWIPSGHWPR